MQRSPQTTAASISLLLGPSFWNSPLGLMTCTAYNVLAVGRTPQTADYERDGALTLEALHLAEQAEGLARTMLAKGAG